MSNLWIQKKFNVKVLSIFNLLRSFPLLLFLFSSHPPLVTKRTFSWKGGHRIFSSPFDLPINTITKIIRGRKEIVIDHSWRNLLLSPLRGPILSSPELNPLFLLIIELVDSLPQLAADLYILFEGYGPETSSFIDFFHRRSIGIYSIPSHPSHDP